MTLTREDCARASRFVAPNLIFIVRILRHVNLGFFAVLGRSPDWMLGVQSGERSRVENVRI